MTSEIIEWWRMPKPDKRGFPMWCGSREGISILLMVQERLEGKSWCIGVKPKDQKGDHQPLPNSGALAQMTLAEAMHFCQSHTNKRLFALGEEARKKRGVTR